MLCKLGINCALIQCMKPAQENVDTPESLAERYGFDLAHTRHVAALALQIFDGTRDKHGLNARARTLLEMGALLHDIAFAVDETHHHTLGRDILLASSLEGVTPVERAVIALMAAFHRKDVRPEDEPVYAALKPGAQRVALILSAILRVADGLDYSHTQTTKVKSVSSGELELRGALCHEDAERAIRKADVWASLTARSQLPALTLRPRLKKPGIKPGDSMRAAAQRIVQWQLDQAPQVDETFPAEQVRQLRVAVRKLRVTLLALHPYLRRKRLLKYMTDVREVLAAVSDARECDMRYERLEAGMAADLAPLRDNWQRKREKSHARMLAALRSPAGHRMVQLRPERLLAERADEALAGEFAAALLKRLANDVLAHEPGLAHASPEELHRLRVAVRRLRMMTAAFKEILPGDETRALLKACKRTQDALGAAHDAHITALAARKFALSGKGLPIAKQIHAFADAQDVAAKIDQADITVFGAIRAFLV